MSHPDIGADAPRVVAVGGGHGTAVTLRAARHYAREITAVVSVADDGGSTGRLREQLDVVALGDLRKCLVALADDSSILSRAFEHRFDGASEGSELSGHAMGNLVLAGLIDATGDLVAGIDAAAALLKAVGRVLPSTGEKVTLKADAAGGEVNGQVAVSRAGRISKVSLDPENATAPPDAVRAILEADQVVIGPGSLFTSVLAVAAAVPAIVDALAMTSACRIYVANLHPQVPETEGYDLGGHVDALRSHGLEVDVVLWDSTTGMPQGQVQVQVDVEDRPLRGSNPWVHDPARLAAALCGLSRSAAPRGDRVRSTRG